MVSQEIIFAGFGGQGILSMAKFLAYAAMETDLNVSWLPSYGPEMRGGTCNCTVTISEEAVGSPIVTEPSSVLVMNRPSLDKFEPMVRPGGLLIMDSNLIDRFPIRSDIEIIAIPAQKEAEEIGKKTIANMVLLGALVKKTGVISEEALLKALKEHGKEEFYEMNKKAIKKGMDCVK